MNQQMVSELKEIYSTMSVNQIIESCDEIKESIEPSELERRLNKLFAHVTETYNSESFAFSFEDKRSNRIRNLDYGASSSYSPFVGNRKTHVNARGSDRDIFHLVCILHEIGHGIDFMKRENPKTFMLRDLEEVAKKEIRAWVYGLRLGLLLGFINKEELDANYVRCMRCLATYLKDFGWEQDNFIDIAKQIYKKVSE